MYKNIKTFEDACKIKNLDPTALPDVSMLPEEHRASIINYYKLIIIASAINGDWKPNWNNFSKRKYFPWFKVLADDSTPSGSALAYGGYCCVDSHSLVGSRLVFKTEEQAVYAGTQFIDYYKEYILIS